jgi:hypothetical protein
MTDDEGSGIDEADPSAMTITADQISAQGNQHPGHQLDEASIAYQLGELRAQARLDILGVVGLEVAVMALVEVDHDGDYFADRQLALAEPVAGSAAQHLLLPVGLETLAEIIDIAE